MLFRRSHWPVVQVLDVHETIITAAQYLTAGHRNAGIFIWVDTAEPT